MEYDHCYICIVSDRGRIPVMARVSVTAGLRQSSLEWSVEWESHFFV